MVQIWLRVELLKKLLNPIRQACCVETCLLIDFDLLKQVYYFPLEILSYQIFYLKNFFSFYSFPSLTRGSINAVKRSMMRLAVRTTKT